MDLTINGAQPGDAAEIAALRNRIADDMTVRYGEGPWSVHTSQPLVLKQMRASQMLVAKEGGEIVGNVRLVTPNLHAFDASAFTPAENPLYVLGLAVSSDCRKRGVGRMLMEAAERAGRERGAQALWLDTYEHAAGAGPFYERCGYRNVGPAPGAEIPLAFFEKSLLVAE